MVEEYLTCEDCGKMDETVKATLCPYDLDINGIETEVNLCPNCEYERAMDI